VQGLGTIGGFKLQVEDRTDQGDAGAGQGDAADPDEGGTRIPPWPASSPTSPSACRSSSPIWTAPRRSSWVWTCRMCSAPCRPIWGSVYINDFNRFGRTYEVIAQADTPFRSRPEDIAQLKVRNNAGAMVPLGSVVNVSETTGPRHRHAL
jgi:hypothetical protein